MSRFFTVLFAACLSGMGVGSGGLYLLYLTEVCGMGQYAAQGANLVFFTLATMAATFVSFRHGRLIPSRLFPLLLYGGAGTFVGAALTDRLPPESASLGLGLLLSVSGLLTLLSLFRRLWRKRGKKKRAAREIP